jgi:hypothetical protein
LTSGENAKASSSTPIWLTCNSYYKIAYDAAKAANERLGLRKGHSSLIKELLYSPELDFSPEIITAFLQTRIAKLTKDEVVAEPSGLSWIKKAKAKSKKVISGARSLVLGLIRVAKAMDPLISVLLPSSPEYAIPYGCLKVLFVVSYIQLQGLASLRLTEVSSSSKKFRQRHG